jgi:hypothetical protein
LSRRTIGKHWRGPKGSYTAICSHCGVAWRSDQLQQELGGAWACPDDYTPGGDDASLAEKNANSAESRQGRQYPYGPPPQKKEVYT